MDNSTIVKLPVEGQEVKPKSKAGRKPDPNKLQFKTIGLRSEQWEWLGLWRPGQDNPTVLVGELVERARAFWPGGPDVFGHKSDKPRKKPLPRALTAYAKQRGLSRQEAIAEVVAAFFAVQEGAKDGAD
jgi:hypothetical protein